MKYRDLKSKTEDELIKIKQELSTEIMKDRALIKIGTKPKSLGNYREAKKTIARINMMLNQM